MYIIGIYFIDYDIVRHLKKECSAFVRIAFLVFTRIIKVLCLRETI